MSVSSCDTRLPMQPLIEATRADRLAGARWLLPAVVARTYDESAGGVIGLLTLGVDWLRRQQLAGLAWVALKHAYSLPAETTVALRQAYYLAVGDTELHRQELESVLHTLAQANLRVVAFKGAALAYTVYPDPACRLMGDIDLWVADVEMAKAQAAVEASGYRFDAKTERPPAWMEQHSGEVRLQGLGKTTGLVELHFGVFAGEWLRRVTCVDEMAIRSRWQPATLAGRSAWTLAPEDQCCKWRCIVPLTINSHCPPCAAWSTSPSSPVTLAPTPPCPKRLRACSAVPTPSIGPSSFNARASGGSLRQRGWC